VPGKFKYDPTRYTIEEIDFLERREKVTQGSWPDYLKRDNTKWRKETKREQRRDTGTASSVTVQATAQPILPTLANMLFGDAVIVGVDLARPGGDHTAMYYRDPITGDISVMTEKHDSGDYTDWKLDPFDLDPDLPAEAMHNLSKCRQIAFIFDKPPRPKDKIESAGVVNAFGKPVKAYTKMRCCHCNRTIDALTGLWWRSQSYDSPLHESEDLRDPPARSGEKTRHEKPHRHGVTDLLDKWK
jgi:hypothetical protein